MLSDDIRALVAQGRRNLDNPKFLEHVFKRLDSAASELESIEESAIVELPPPPANVAWFRGRRGRRNT